MIFKSSNFLSYSLIDTWRYLYIFYRFHGGASIIRWTSFSTHFPQYKSEMSFFYVYHVDFNHLKFLFLAFYPKCLK